MKDMSEIAVLVRERRQQLLLSQQDLSEMCLVSLRTINALESGRAFISLKNLVAITDILGLELSVSLKKMAVTDETGL